MTEEGTPIEPEFIEVEGEADDDYDRSRQRINIGLHPLGGVVLDVVDAYGRNAVVQLEGQLLGQLILNLITLNVVRAQQEAQAAQEEYERAQGIWQPNQRR